MNNIFFKKEYQRYTKDNLEDTMSQSRILCKRKIVHKKVYDETEC